MAPDEIKLLRKILDLTQTDLAKKLGISPRTVQAYEAGVSVPGGDKLLKLLRLRKENLHLMAMIPGQKRPIRDLVVELVQRQDEALGDLLFNEFLEKLLYKRLDELKESKSKTD